MLEPFLTFVSDHCSAHWMARTEHLHFSIAARKDLVLVPSGPACRHLLLDKFFADSTKIRCSSSSIMFIESCSLVWLPSVGGLGITFVAASLLRILCLREEYHDMRSPKEFVQLDALLSTILAVVPCNRVWNVPDGLYLESFHRHLWRVSNGQCSIFF